MQRNQFLREIREVKTELDSLYEEKQKLFDKRQLKSAPGHSVLTAIKKAKQRKEDLKAEYNESQGKSMRLGKFPVKHPERKPAPKKKPVVNHYHELQRKHAEKEKAEADAIKAEEKKARAKIARANRAAKKAGEKAVAEIKAVADAKEKKTDA